MKKNKRILYAVLNWGLGHASRSVPLIREIMLQGAEVVIGSDNESLHFLKKHFPDNEFIDLPAYNVRYKYNNMFRNIAPQLPALIKILTKERNFLKDIINDYALDAVISDNRYGLNTESIPSVFITHQLNIRIPNKTVQWGVNRLNRHFLNKFSEIWVPDFREEPSLSGNLGHGAQFKNIRYIGPLSRLELNGHKTETYEIVALLSGPEPQRSYFEKTVLEQLQDMPQKSLIIKGKPDENFNIEIDGVFVEAFADMDRLAALLKGASLVISRSGYSSLMDYAKLNVKPLLLVPTPGQTEQEYLAENLFNSGAALLQKQNQLDIRKAWSEKEKCKGLQFDFNEDVLKKTVSDFLMRL